MLRAMGALTDLWKSERGLVCIVALICVTVVFGLGRITSDQWLESMKWIITVYVGGKSLTSAVETIKGVNGPIKLKDGDLTVPTKPSSETTIVTSATGDRLEVKVPPAP